MKKYRPLFGLILTALVLPACGLDFGQKDDAMSVEELKFYLLGQMYYEREVHCSYYPKDCPSEETEIIIITQANDPDDEDKIPITVPAVPSDPIKPIAPTDPNKVVAYGFDTNGDGFVDTVAVDSDGDGRADKVLYVDDEEKIEPEDESEIADCQSVTTIVNDPYGSQEEVTAKLCGTDTATGTSSQEGSEKKPKEAFSK